MEQNVKTALEVIAQELEKKVTGNRNIVVLDKGWIFVGNLANNGDETFSLSNVCNLRKWQAGGFGMVVTEPAKAQVTLDKCGDINFRSASVIFTAPISENWGK